MSKVFAETEPMQHHRQEDGEPVKITREIPLPWLLSAIGIAILQAGSLYYGQVSQGEKLIAVQSDVSRISAKLDVIVTNQSKADLKDLEHDLKITALQNRIGAIENVLQRQLPNALGPATPNLGQQK